MVIYMKSKKLYQGINNIDDDLIEGAAEIKTAKVIPFKRYLAIAACFIVVVGGYWGVNQSSKPQIDLTDRIVIEEMSPEPEFSQSVTVDGTGEVLPEISGSIMADMAVNIEGIITEVGKDGLSFKLDNGKWVYVNDDTIIGTTCYSIEEKESLYFEPTFRVGNAISGFTLDTEAEEIIAYAIYNNWNWEDPIR